MRIADAKPGVRVGRLTIESITERGAGRISNRRDATAMCDCGTRTLVDLQNLGKVTFSCGCLGRERQRTARLKHGGTANRQDTREYRVWNAMKSRCENERSPSFSYYGGRGITVCERWSGSFEAFLADMGPRPAGTSIDRIDNSRGYEPNNCRWATTTQQARNKRNNRRVTIDGETLCVPEWAERYGISAQTIYTRMSHGWDDVRAITEPLSVAHSEGVRRALRTRRLTLATGAR